jgi:SAM-dependent methyltransferase
MDRFDLYERCVQSPVELAAMLASLHGGSPRILREDFSGTGALSRAWVRADPSRSAIAIDLDPEPLAKCRDVAKVTCRVADAVAATDRDEADLIFVGNFSLGYLHHRRDLDAYLRASRARLRRGGLFAGDMYGGPGAWRLGGLARVMPLDEDGRLHYWWEHEAADASTGLVRNAISFRVERRGEIVEEWPRAFIYSWRLWSMPELREAMLEAGFTRVEAHLDLSAEVAPPEAFASDWTALVVARL